MDEEKKIEEVVEETITETETLAEESVETAQNTEEIRPDDVMGEDMASLLGGLAGAGGQPSTGYSDVLQIQSQINERFDSSINKLDDNIEIVNNDLEDTKVSLLVTKLYTKLLTKMIIGTDIVFIIAIILLIIFK